MFVSTSMKLCATSYAVNFWIMNDAMEDICPYCKERYVQALSCNDVRRKSFVFLSGRGIELHTIFR